MVHAFGSKRVSRRTFLSVLGGVTVGSALLAACARRPAAHPLPKRTRLAAAALKKPKSAFHMVQKQDVSDWIQAGLDQDIDGFVSNNPDIEVVLETIPGWTAEYFPKVLSFAAAGSLGDVVWFPPRHRSHISGASATTL
ncbi:MAG: hypothetical protein R2911_06575 [Caldilineaceae bacterium]